MKVAQLIVTVQPYLILVGNLVLVVFFSALILDDLQRSSKRTSVEWELLFMIFLLFLHLFSSLFYLWKTRRKRLPEDLGQVLDGETMGSRPKKRLQPFRGKWIYGGINILFGLFFLVVGSNLVIVLIDSVQHLSKEPSGGPPIYLWMLRFLIVITVLLFGGGQVAYVGITWRQYWKQRREVH